MKISSILLSLAIITFGLVPDFGFAGGGGSSSGGGGGGGGGGFSGGSSHSSSSSNYASEEDDPWITLVVFAIIVIIFIIGFRADKNDIKKKKARNNSTEQEKWIHTEGQRIFEQYQKDWTEFNLNSIKTYTTSSYFEHTGYMLELLKDLHRVNKVSKLKVNYVCLLNPVSDKTSLPANIRIEFGFSGLDEVINTANSKNLYKKYVASVNETWNFVYDGKTLKLSGISQPTESAPHLIKSLADFATQNKLFYSPDWGRYALPARGLIFGKSSMSVSDINNHIIGKWGDLLIQLYTYAETPGVPSSYYLVGQINVPKDYLGVIVKSLKYKTHHKPEKSYEKFEMEWPDFNDRYEVYAAKRDALPAFELLNPKFMEYLYDKNLNYNLEVVDNVIYIFANVKNITEADYAELLTVLEKAHKELKM